MGIIRNFIDSLFVCFKKKDYYHDYIDDLNQFDSMELKGYVPNFLSHLDNGTDEIDDKLIVLESIFDSKNDVPKLKDLINDDIITENTSVNHSNSLIVTSYNISTNSKYYDWHNRQNNISKIISDIDPDIMTLYECHTILENDLINFMKKKLSNYVSLQFVGGPNCHIIISVNNEKFTINHHGMKWLSNTPDIKSTLWDSDETKIIAYLNITDNKTNKKYWIFSTQLCKNNKNKILVTTIVSEIIKKISGTNIIGNNNSIIFMCDENYNDFSFNDRLRNSFETNLDNMMYCSKNIYAMINKYKIRINGNLIGYYNSELIPYIKNKTYGICSFIMAKNIKSSVCYTLFLNNSVDCQPSSYLPLILYIPKN